MKDRDQTTVVSVTVDPDEQALAAQILSSVKG